MKFSGGGPKIICSKAFATCGAISSMAGRPAGFSSKTQKSLMYSILPANTMQLSSWIDSTSLKLKAAIRRISLSSSFKSKLPAGGKYTAGKWTRSNKNPSNVSDAGDDGTCDG